MTGLTSKRKRFVEEYLVDLNATQAAIRTGYSPKTADVQGCRLLTNARVQAAIVEAQDRRSERVEVDQDYVILGLKENKERAMQQVAVVDKDGKETGEFAYNGAVANRSLELLGKHIGMFVERHELTGKDGAPLITITEIVVEKPAPEVEG